MKAQRNRTWHEVLRQLPYGLYAVGVRGANGDMNGFVASWVTQCSFDPPLLMVAIRTDSSSFEMLKRGKVFSLNLLDKKEKDLARLLVKPRHRVGDKLGKIAHIGEDTGAPILRRAFAYVECRVRSIYAPGDHALVVGEVVNVGRHCAGQSMTCADMRWHYAG